MRCWQRSPGLTGRRRSWRPGCGKGQRTRPAARPAYYGQQIVAAAQRRGADFSITARKDRAVTAAIATIAGDVWTKIRYPKAVFDDELNRWVSDAEVAEIRFTAFAFKGKSGHVAARLLVLRILERQPRPCHHQRAG